MRFSVKFSLKYFFHSKYKIQNLVSTRLVSRKCHTVDVLKRKCSMLKFYLERTFKSAINLPNFSLCMKISANLLIKLKQLFNWQRQLKFSERHAEMLSDLGQRISGAKQLCGYAMLPKASTTRKYRIYLLGCFDSIRHFVLNFSMKNRNKKEGTIKTKKRRRERESRNKPYVAE